MTGDGHWLMRGEGEAELGGLLLQVDQLPFLLGPVILRGANVIVRHVMLEHVIHSPGNLVSGRHQRRQR